MGFLSGWFIAGITAVALPVIFHMIRRTPSGRIPFSTLMFLEPSPPTITKRSRVDNWLLLLLRAAAITLLAFAFARPFLRVSETKATTATTGKHLAVLVDTSASMRRAELWQAAVERTLETVDKANAGDKVALYCFDHSTTPIVSFAEWSELEAGVRADVVRARLAELEPTWAGTDVGRALVVAAEDIESLEMDDKDEARIEASILLISDMQQGAALESLQNYEWPKKLSVAVEVVGAEPTNAGLQLLAPSDEDVNRVRVRVSNAAGSSEQQFMLGWENPDGSLADAQPVYVAPGRSRTVALDPIDDNIARRKITLLGDEHEFDNSVYCDSLQSAAYTISYIGKDEVGDPESLRFYLERAFPTTRARAVNIVSSYEQTVVDKSVAMLVVGGDLPTEYVSNARKYVESGGTLLFVANNADGVASVGPLFADDLDTQGDEATVVNYAMITQIDYDHPVFAPFADAKFADFTRIHVWKHRTLPASIIEGGQVLASFDDGDAAIVERSVGKGRVVVFATGWHPADSQLALSTKFVPLMNAILDHAQRAPLTLPRVTVGESLALAPFRGLDTDSATLIEPPGGEIVELENDVSSFDQTDKPGTYQLTTGDTTGRFVVNLDPDESNTAVLPLERLESLGVAMRRTPDAVVTKAEAARDRQLKRQELERRQKYWRWIILAALIVLLLETWLAGRIARKSQSALAGANA